MKRLLSIGVIGSGKITSQVHLPVLLNIPNVRIDWIADINEAVAHNTAVAFGINNAIGIKSLSQLPSCDLALLAVPVYARSIYLRHFALTDASVLSEKPFAITVAEHLEYLDLFSTKSRINVGYMRRTFANVRTFALAVSEGWFGPLRRIIYAEGARTTATTGGTDNLDRPQSEGGGVLRDLGCHAVDVIGMITGQPSYEVRTSSILWDGRTDRHIEAKFDLEGLHGKSGTTCTVDFKMSWIADQSNTMQLEFDQVRLCTDVRPDGDIWLESIDGQRRNLNIEIIGARSTYQAFGMQWQAVLESMLSGVPSNFEAAGSLWTTELLEALYLSGGSNK
jgi:predicted dehydrogenase